MGSDAGNPVGGRESKVSVATFAGEEQFSSPDEVFLTGVQWIELLGNPPRIWMPQILRALNRAGVKCDEMSSAELTGERVIQPTQLDWSLDGLRSVARFTDQLWAFPADRPMPNANRLLMRGLGEPQTGVQHSFRIGSRIRIGIESEHDGHLILLDEGPEQKIFCLCPSHFARHTRLLKGTSILPHSDSVYDAFVLTGVPGREQLLAIVTDEPMDLNWMPSDSAGPARVLEQDDVDDLLSALQLRPSGSWTALATYFDVVFDP